MVICKNQLWIAGFVTYDQISVLAYDLATGVLHDRRALLNELSACGYDAVSRPLLRATRGERAAERDGALRDRQVTMTSAADHFLDHVMQHPQQQHSSVASNEHASNVPTTALTSSTKPFARVSTSSIPATSFEWTSTAKNREIPRPTRSTAEPPAS